jgi:hypothetical protein
LQTEGNYKQPHVWRGIERKHFGRAIDRTLRARDRRKKPAALTEHRSHTFFSSARKK